jgi:hypothetical protein
MTEENLTGVVTSSDAAKNTIGAKERDPGTSGKSQQAGSVRTVDLPSKDVKPFSAEQLGSTAGGQKSQTQSSKSPGGSSGNRTPAKQAPRFIDDEGGDGDDGAENKPSAKGPKKAG